MQTNLDCKVFVNRSESSVCYLVRVLGNQSRYPMDDQAPQAVFKILPPTLHAIRYIPPGNKTSSRRLKDVSLYVPATWQVRLTQRNEKNETPNDVLVERCQDISLVRLQYILLERNDDVSIGRYNDVPSVRLLYVSNKSQMKHPTTSQWYVTKTSKWNVSLMSHQYVSTTSSVNLKRNTQ